MDRRQRKGVIKEYGLLLKHLTTHIVDPLEPIDPRDFRQAKGLIDSIKKVKKGGFRKLHKSNGD